MCGIAGFVDFKSRSTADILQNMTDALLHRGPDGTGVLLKNAGNAQVGLGHRRLSIIDLSNCAAQPMTYDGLHVIFNGEIYNYAEIREALIAKGHEFSSHSDTEVIIHALREWGFDAVHRWNGMFTIILYDEATGSVSLLRDRAGVKPLYYYWHNDLLLFGSELKALLAHPQFEKQVDAPAVSAFMQYGYVPEPHCIFQHTYKLAPGHRLDMQLASKEIRISQYWNVYDYYNKPKIAIGPQEAVEETERILEKGFQYRMVADVPVGVFLSGGFDSTCVTALLQKNSTEKLKTFTIGTDDKKHNEAPYAKDIAHRLGTDHTEYYCTPKEAIDIIPELPYYYDEPFADSSAIPTILVSRLARARVTVALSADAGDEIFAGYNKYEYLLRYSKKLGQVPKPLRRMAAGVMNKIPSESIPYFRNKYNFNSRYQKIKGLLDDPSPAQMMKSITKVFLSSELEALFDKPVNEVNTKHISDEMHPDSYDPLSYMMAVDYQTYMSDGILQKVDRATMSVSLEGREPFLDQHIIQWAAQLPSSLKIYQGEKKYLLKQIVYKYVPAEVMNRPKMGFSIPIDDWLQNELKPLVMENLHTDNLKHGLFNRTEVAKIVNAFYGGRTELYVKVWHLLMFQMWYLRWVK